MTSSSPTALNTHPNGWSRVKTLWPVCLLILGLFILFNIRLLTILPPSIDNQAAFNTDRALERLERILGDETPHTVDSDANDGVRTRILEEIRALGFDPIVRDDFHCASEPAIGSCARVQNILFWVSDPGPYAVMLASHYDSVPTGPGAADDGSGVAASLEVASILSARTFARPLLVLITDGEEVGLIGASSFVETDPLAKDIGAVVSFEARGISGRASLIQTSQPNGRDIATLKPGNLLPISSSLNTDIYELLPNDTDVTQYLKLGIDASNLAFSKGPHHYHTPLDTLDNLDPRTVYHMGTSGLTAAETFLSQNGDEPEIQWIYMDVLGQFKLALPQAFSPFLMALGALMAIGLWAYGRQSHTPKPAIWRAALFPPFTVIFGLTLAIGMTELIATIRPEASFGTAHPWALRALHNSAALLGGIIALCFCWRPTSQISLLASAWLWFALLGGLLSHFIPGAAIIFTPALMIFSVSVFAILMGYQHTARWLAILASLWFALTVIPLSAGGEIGLIIENAAPFTIALLLLFMLSAPLTLRNGLAETRTSWARGTRRLLAAVTALVVIISTGLALIVPAYSPAAPRGLSIWHMASDPKTDAATDAIWAIANAEPLPDALANAADFIPQTLRGLRGQHFTATAPEFPVQDFDIAVISDQVTDGMRTLKLHLISPQMDRLWMTVPSITGIRSAEINGTPIVFTPQRDARLRCYGRTCRDMDISLIFDAQTVAKLPPDYTVTLLSAQHGLGPESAALYEARPDWAVPQHWGDLRVHRRSITLAPSDTAL